MPTFGQARLYVHCTTTQWVSGMYRMYKEQGYSQTAVGKVDRFVAKGEDEKNVMLFKFSQRVM